MQTMLRGLLLILLAWSPFAAGADLAVSDILRILGEPEQLTADFTQQKQSPSVAVELDSRGRFVLSREKGFLWMTSEPFEDVVGFSKTKRGYLDESGRWIVLSNEHSARVMEWVREFLTKGSDELSRYFFLSPSGSRSEWRLLVTPKDDGTAARFLTEVLLTGGEHLQRIQIVQTDGTITRLFLSNVRENPTLSRIDQDRLEALQ